MIKFFFPYIGNKWNESKKLYDIINDDIDDIETIVEPFCGSCAFSMYGSLKMDIHKKYHFNDIDKQLMQCLKDIKDGKLKKYIDYCNRNGQKYYNDIKLWQSDIKQDVKDIYKWFMIKKLSRGHLLHGFSYKNETNEHKLMKYESYNEHENFLMSDDVELSNIDYMDILEKYKDDEKALLFLDPPYLDSYNAFYDGYEKGTKQKFIKDNTQIYVDIINFLKNCKCKVLMIINENALTKYLYGDYVRETYEKIYQLTKKKTFHMIIYNGTKKEKLKVVKNKSDNIKLNKRGKIELLI